MFYIVNQKGVIMKKSQAAMEFLMTYGWAILVVLVAIGALAYFGVLSPDRFLPYRCILPSGIACLDHEVRDVFGPGNGEVYVVIKNSLGYDIKIVYLRASKCTSSTSEEIIKNGDQARLTATGCTVTSGEKYSGDINITYTNADTGLEHKKRGSISVRAVSVILE